MCAPSYTRDILIYICILGIYLLESPGGGQRVDGEKRSYNIRYTDFKGDFIVDVIFERCGGGRGGGEKRGARPKRQGEWNLFM